MSKLYNPLYKSCFCILFAMSYVCLATQSPHIDFSYKIILSVDANLRNFYGMKDEEIKVQLVKNKAFYLNTNPQVRYSFYVSMETIKKTNLLLFETIQKHLEYKKYKEFSLCHKKGPIYPNIYCFNGNSRAWANHKTTTFYAIRFDPKFGFYRLHFDRILAVSESQTKHTPHYFKFQGTEVYFEDIFPITKPKIVAPILPKPTRKKISSTKKQKATSYVGLHFTPFNKDTEQFIAKYSTNKTKNGTFTFKKYPQHVKCLALKEKFAEKISSTLQNIFKKGIDSAFIYLYNHKKERINLSKKDLPHYNPSIKQLYKEQALDKEQKGNHLSMLPTLYVLYKIHFYPTLFQNCFKS